MLSTNEIRNRNIFLNENCLTIVLCFAKFWPQIEHIHNQFNVSICCQQLQWHSPRTIYPLCCRTGSSPPLAAVDDALAVWAARSLLWARCTNNCLRPSNCACLTVLRGEDLFCVVSGLLAMRRRNKLQVVGKKSVFEADLLSSLVYC